MATETSSVLAQSNLLITPDTKVYELLKFYPKLEEKLIQLVPSFNKLKNPILRKTIAKVTSLRQAATVGEINLSFLISELRNVIGQDNNEIITDQERSCITMPSWINTLKKKTEYDAISDIDNGIHPINKVLQESAELNNDEYYLLITNFIPQPLIDTLSNKGFETYTKKLDSIKFGTYIRKQ